MREGGTARRHHPSYNDATEEIHSSLARRDGTRQCEREVPNIECPLDLIVDLPLHLGSVVCLVDRQQTDHQHQKNHDVPP